MLRPQGYQTVTLDRMVEHDTITCGHCGCIVTVKPGHGGTVYLLKSLYVDPITRRATIVTKEEMGAGCRQCDKPICLPCYDKAVCTPLMRRIEAMEAGVKW